MELDDNLIRGSECEWPLNCTMTLISFELLQIFFFVKIFLCFWEIISVHACQKGFAKISQIRRKSSSKANCQWLLIVYQVIISICSHFDICKAKVHALNKNPLMWGFLFFWIAETMQSIRKVTEPKIFISNQMWCNAAQWRIAISLLGAPQQKWSFELTGSGVVYCGWNIVMILSQPHAHTSHSDTPEGLPHSLTDTVHASTGVIRIFTHCNPRNLYIFKQ